jgi:hypothetical protein
VKRNIATLLLIEDMNEIGRKRIENAIRIWINERPVSNA